MASEERNAPTYDAAVFGFCELVGLMFGLPAGEALYRGEPVSTHMVFFAAIGGAFAVTGPLWPRLKNHLPRKLALSFVGVASNFLWWMVILVAIYTWQSLIVPITSLTRESSRLTDQTKVLVETAQKLSTKASPTATPTPAPVFLDKPPQFFAGLVEGRTDFQVVELTRPFLGKWMKLSSKVVNVLREMDRPVVTMEFPVFNKKDPIVIQAWFDESWNERASHLNRGDKIVLVGRVDRIFQDGGFSLGDCSFAFE